jgi:hypothetical protein
MTHLDELIGYIRQTTENNDTNGILDSEFIKWFNDAQKHIQRTIFMENPDQDYFTDVGYIQIDGSSEYSLKQLYADTTFATLVDTNMLASGSINNVEYSSSNANTTYPLKRISPKQKRYDFGYWTRGDKIAFTPSINIGILKITYTKLLPKLDKRRGLIDSSTSGTSIILAAGSVPNDTDFSVNTISVIDSDGNIIIDNVNVSSYSSVTRTISTNTTWAGSIDDYYVVYGKNTTDVSGLDDICEEYLTQFVEMRTGIRDSSSDLKNYATVLGAIEISLKDLYADNNTDASYIPVLTTDYLNM